MLVIKIGWDSKKLMDLKGKKNYLLVQLIFDLIYLLDIVDLKCL